MYNDYMQSFNGKVPDECLNGQSFKTRRQARSAIPVWRHDYNEVRYRLESQVEDVQILH